MALAVIRFEGHQWPVEVFVAVGAFEEWQAFDRRRWGTEADPDDPPGAAQGGVRKRPGVGWDGVIWMPYFRPGNAFDQGKLAHEALHVAWRVLDKLGSYDEEAHCYLVQWIVSQFMDRFDRRSRAQRKQRDQRRRPRAARRAR